MESITRRRVGSAAGVIFLAVIVVLSSCEEKRKAGPIIMGPEKSAPEELELHPEQKRLLSRLVMMSPVLNPGHVQRINTQWSALASQFCDKYMNEWKNPEALKQYAQELDEKDQAAFQRLNDYFRFFLCGGVLREDTYAGKREALRGIMELVRYEGESRFWSILQNESGSCVESQSLGLLEKVLPEAGVALPYDWKPESWHEKIYGMWLAWWKENHKFLVYDADKQVYKLNSKAKESGKPVNPVSGDEMTPEEIETSDAVLARILDWIKKTRFY